MKKINIHRDWLFFVGFVVLMGVQLYWGMRFRKHLKMNDVVVKILPENFIIDKDIREIVNDLGYDSGAYASKVMTGLIEHRIKNDAYCAASKVYKSVDGRVHVEVEEQKMLARIFFQNGASLYLSDKGVLITLSERYNERVLVVSGYIPAENFTSNSINEQSIVNNDFGAEVIWTQDLFKLVQYINQDPFWSAQIAQVYVQENKKIKLVPRVGMHNIEMGTIDAFKSKMENLFLFYKKGLVNRNWNLYRTINLEYKNQVVCSK